MNGKTLIAGLIGGIVFFIIGGVLYGWLLVDYFATSASRAEPLFVPILVGELSAAFLLAYTLGGMKTDSAAGGMRGGVVVGVLYSLSFGFILYGAYDLSTLGPVLTDVALSAVRFGIVGAIMGWWMGRGSEIESAPAAQV